MKLLPLWRMVERWLWEMDWYLATRGEKADGANGDEKQEDSQPLEQQSPAWPPLLQQQQELLAPPPQEPWPPPLMAAEHEGSGAGSCGESRLELVEGGSTARLDFSFGDGLGGLGGGGEESYTADGSAWERAGIGTGRPCSRAFWGCEVTGRLLTQLRQERVREK